jgi:hypothetical protein
MVRAILDKRKTQTRRIVKGSNKYGVALGLGDTRVLWDKCPYGEPGDRLWVRETWGPCAGGIVYRADGATFCPDGGKWKPSIHIPRWASRITLEIESRRVERLIEISNDDAIAEGLVYSDSCWYPTDDPKVSPWMTALGAYRDLWESINGAGSWDANPWVWVIQFSRIQP